MIYGFIAGNAVEKIFQLPQYKKNAEILGIVSGIIISLLTRFSSTIKVYLAPFKINDNEYDLKLLDLNMDLAKRSVKIPDIIGPFVLGAVRGTGLGAIFFSVLTLAVHNITLCIFFSMLPGSLYFAHSFYADRKANIFALARKHYDQEQPTALNENEKQIRINRCIAYFLNFGSRTALGLLCTYSVYLLLRSTMGNIPAVIFGLSVSFETAWVNFHYYIDKISSRIAELRKNISECPSCCFFKKTDQVGTEESLLRVNYGALNSEQKEFIQTSPKGMPS